MAELSLEEYMAMSFSNFGPRTKFLKSWKKRQPARLDLWLHTKFGFRSIVSHKMRKIVVREDRQTGQQKVAVYGEDYCCWDSDARIAAAKRSEAFDEARATCPLCLLLSELRKMIDRGELLPDQRIFEFVGDDGVEVVTAAGALGFNWDELTEEQLKSLNKAGINQANGWMQDARPKQQFVFALVDNEAVADGVQITTETKLVGEKLKDVIHDEMVRNSPDGQFHVRQTAGNPLAEPYCIRFEHYPRAQQFNKKYHVMSLPKVPLTDEIRKLIVDDDPPDTTHVTGPFNAHALKSLLEQCSVVELPLDQCFDTALKVEAEREQNNPAAGFDPATSDQAPPDRTHVAGVPRETVAAKPQRELVAEAAKRVAAQQATAVAGPTTGNERKKPPPPANQRRVKSPAVAPEELGDPCDVCKAPMAKDASKCQACGAEYESAAAQPDDDIAW